LRAFYFDHFSAPLAEIARTLKTGGAHVFTVPYYRGKTTVIRAGEFTRQCRVPHETRLSCESDRPMRVASGHGMGDELCDFIFRASGMTTTIFNFFDPRFGLEGEFLDVLN
jgi:hypothetical protein